MISESDEPRRDLFLRDGLEAADVVRAHHEALRVLRDDIESAHVDAYSDAAWPREAVPAYEHALAMARSEVVEGVRSERDDPGMGIDVDVRDDTQFDVLLTLAPFTIHAEAWRRGRQVFGAGDTGTALWVSVTARQEARLVSRLDAPGASSPAFTARPRRRRGPLSRFRGTGPRG